MAMPFASQYANNQPQLPSGSSVAPFNANQTAGQNQTLSAGAPGGSLSQEAGNAAGAQKFLTSGEAFNPATNPGLAATIEGAVRPIEQNYAENIAPAIREGGVGVGQFGGGREGALEGIATQAEQQAVGSTAGSIESQNYQNALDQMTKAMGLTPTVQQASLEPGIATSNVGDVQQQLTQEQLTEAFNRFMFPQEQPLSTAESLSSIAAGIPGGSTTTTGSVNTQMSPLQMAMGFGALGSSLFGGQNGIFPGALSSAGQGIGSAFSSLFPLMFA